MFKKIFLVLIISINLFIFADKTSDSLIDKYIIDKSKPTEFIKLTEYKESQAADFITRYQFFEDIKVIKYIFNNGYSGKDYWSKNGIDFDLMYKKLDELGNTKKSKISVREIECILAESLKNIIDGHLTIFGESTYRFFKHKDVYFADILIEKRDNNYFVIYSKQQEIKEGMRFDDSQDLLFKTLSPKGKEHFLIGILSYEKISNFNIKFDSKEYVLKLHPNKFNEANFNNDKVFYLEEKENIPIIHVTNFGVRNDKELLKYVEYGKELKNSFCFILNLYNNKGGSSNYPMQFFININNFAAWENIYAELITPATLQAQIHRFKYLKDPRPDVPKWVNSLNKTIDDQKKNPKYYWNIRNLYTDNETGTFNGTAIILINRNVASSGEAAISYSKCLKNSILIGENSAGIGTFGEVYFYILPNSKIRFQLPGKLFLMKDFYEGIGFIPDYWLDSNTPINEIINWIKNPEEYIFELK